MAASQEPSPQRTYPPGVPCWLDLPTADPDGAIAFYGGLFGWAFDERLPASAPDRYAVARLGVAEVAAVASAADDDIAAPGWRTFVGVTSADATAAAVVAAGGQVLVEPQDVGPAGRMALLADPAGAVLAAWQPAARTGAGLVNAPGAWNWSDLHTPDPEAATAFYGAVFGWEARPVAVGGFQATMWCVPGYGEFLDERDPSRRERHAADGVPPGFADAVGWLLPAGEGTPPHWHVTFAVADTDAVAARGAELGGRIVSPPRTAGPTRLAELEDPAGATFTISAYQP